MVITFLLITTPFPEYFAELPVSSIAGGADTDSISVPADVDAEPQPANSVASRTAMMHMERNFFSRVPSILPLPAEKYDYNKP